ncbi:hypothetical protein PPSIR1_28093 [Plesiocystis pacifica SIR-1]|uniref:Uncharacterized protein n=1 Tax=Plesiocystis pacifica SIR-1 TaxID=391625 RepID=A6FZP1_9BACT|nr:choice-of-anchor L domain-containing protein [Plesiocystis pacifica]EDM80847.1 hypothetical protein PPSIR1_28093 [Plesiocystis pacifica SIR-1]
MTVAMLSLAACPGDDGPGGGTSLGDDETLPTGDDEVGSESTGESGETGDTGSTSGTETETETDSSTDASTDTDTDTTEETGEEPCTTNEECEGDPNGPICEMGACVECTEEQDPCDVGLYCVDNLCEVGCADDEDCPDGLLCDTEENSCTGCVVDTDCPLGSVCEEGDCVAGCTDEQPCQDGFTCCAGDCQDLLNDPNNCGDCDEVCPDFPNAEDLCTDGGCMMGECEDGFFDCNGDPVDGCESSSQCACTPGDTISCYDGFPPATEGVGECQAGTRTCNDQGTSYGPCEGQVLPVQEICNNGLDDNCNGQTDENPDDDNDGWGVCDNDCCDQVGPDCATPDVVNPGAFEVDGDDVDNDCDGQVDNPVPLCDAGLASNSSNPLDYARSIDLCQFTSENPPLSQRIWGVIDADLQRANGTGSPNANSRSIRPGFGNNNSPQAGSSFALMSSGFAAAPGQTNPAHAGWETGNDMGADVGAPADWLAANGGSFPNAPGCTISGNTNANDSVMLKVRVRVPTNANSFSAKFNFFSSEYPEYVCTSFNDFFITLVDSTDPDNPNDKNIAVYDDGNNTWPVSVNIGAAADGLFTQCDNGTISCFGTPQNYNGCVSENGLLGTGFDAFANACNGNDDVGGATGWLTMSGNVTPGETMEIRFVIWDTADSVWDSLVIVDDWQWSVQGATPGVQPPG